MQSKNPHLTIKNDVIFCITEVHIVFIILHKIPIKIKEIKHTTKWCGARNYTEANEQGLNSHLHRCRSLFAVLQGGHHLPALGFPCFLVS